MSSYNFGTFSENQSELERLVLQATQAIEIERELWRSSRISAKGDVLDIGCGPGVVSHFLNEYTQGDLIGLDSNALLLAEANRRKSEENWQKISFVEGSVYELPFAENQFDYVYSRFLFQHLTEPEKALAEIFRVLKPNGSVGIVDVDDRCLFVSPKSEAFLTLTEKAAFGQKQNGGNRCIGAMLPELYTQTGFTEINVQIRMITSYEIGFKTFLDITTGFKAEQFYEEDQAYVKELLAEIYNLTEIPYAWGAVGVFFAEANK